MPDVAVEIRLDGAATGGALALAHVTVPPGAGAGFHRHTLEDETIVVTEGELTLAFDDGERVVPSGGDVFLPRGTRHSFRNDGSRIVRAFFVATPAGLEEFFRSLERGEDPAAAAARAGLELG